MKQKAVFLDRDGVINEAVVINGKPYPPPSLSELKLIPGVKDGVYQLKKAGYKIFVITNQPDVARGITPVENIHLIHSYLKVELDLDEVRCCFHDDTDNCQCRKPKPGMILELTEKWDIDLSTSYLIGDRWRDIEAGKAANITSILIDYGYNEKKTEPDFLCTDFISAVNTILH